jgi:hypothetical protein
MIELLKEESCMNLFMMEYVRPVVISLQYAISLAGILIIVSGIAIAITQYLKMMFRCQLAQRPTVRRSYNPHLFQVIGEVDV